MLNTFPFAFFALICLVIGDPELAPATALTKFRDLTFFNNLVHFVDETTPQNGHNPPQKITARVEEEKGDDFDGGYDGSESKNTYDEGPSEDVETKTPTTLISKKGVKVEVNKQKKVSYDTEFTLSLKWRPFRTVKSIKKMLFFFPKKIEQTAFGTWEHLRGGSSKRKKASKESNEGFDEKAIGTQPVKDSRPFYEPFDDNDLVYCDDGGSDSCYGYPADVFDDDYWSEFDDDNEEEDCEGIDEEEDDDDGEDDYKLGRYSSKSSEYDEECSESDGECNTGGSTEDWSDNDIKAEVGSDPNYPFFVRLSSYTPDPEGSFNLTSQSTKDSVQKSQKEAGSKGSRNSVGKNSKNSNGKSTKDTGVKGKYPISKGSFSQNMRPSSEPDLETPPEEVQTNHRSRRKTRNRPNYVLVDSDILVNTMCPHMLNDFKSSPQQWGKKKEVFVNIYNATVQGQDRARFFPGDQVSSMGSFVRRSMGTLVVGLLSSIIPF